MSRLKEAWTDSEIVVDVRSLLGAVQVLDATSRSVDELIRAVRTRAIDAYSAIAPSDLQDAYGYCWGRWSQTMLDVAATLDQAQRLTDRAAQVYAAVDGSVPTVRR